MVFRRHSTFLTVAMSVTALMAVAFPAGAQSPAVSPAASAAVGASAPAADPNDLLALVKQAGILRVSIEPAYPPQSQLMPDGTFQGFNVDVANEIGKRLGVTTQFETPTFDAVVAGGWADRWDLSVGSVTITQPREQLLDFSPPYYYNPAQMAATTSSGITTLDGLAGQVICVGAATTYFDWINGNLVLAGGVPAPAAVPAGATATTFATDTDCAAAISGGRNEFAGWLSASPTIDLSIKSGAPFVTVGDPVFYEALAAAVDKAGPPHAEFMAALDSIIADMHTDGTLSTLSKKWFGGLDLTVAK